MSPTTHSAAPPLGQPFGPRFGLRFGLMAARSVKRWARGLVFVWFGLWLSAALLHCDELAAVAHDQALSADCEHPAHRAPDSGGVYKTAVCLVVDELAPASAAGLAGPVGGSLSLSVLYVSPSFYLVPSPAVPSLPSAYRAAPPPVAVYLRNSRLLV